MPAKMITGRLYLLRRYLRIRFQLQLQVFSWRSPLELDFRYRYRPFSLERGERVPLELDYSQCLVPLPEHCSFLDKHHEKICKVVLTFVLAIIITLTQTLSKRGQEVFARNPVGESEVFFGMRSLQCLTNKLLSGTSN